MLDDTSHESSLDGSEKHNSNKSFCLLAYAKGKKGKRKKENQGITLLGDSCIISALNNARQKSRLKNNQKKSRQKIG